MSSSKYLIGSILVISSLVSGCDILEKAKQKTESILKINEIPQSLTKTKSVTITCERGKIEDYTSKGWKIKSSEQKEMTCSWKAKKSKPGCNMNTDKGCRIYVPDKKGSQINYILEKKVSIEGN